MADFTSHPIQPWILWLALALLAGFGEILVPYFAFSFASFAAALTALIAVWFGWEVQVVSFVFTLLLTLILARPFLLKKLQTPHKLPSRSQALLGLKGEVTIDIDNIKNTGRVLVNGEDWLAVSDQTIPKGQSVEITGADGIVLHVKEI